MRLRYVVAVWILGALVGGFALGQIVERNLFMRVLKERRAEHGYHIMTAPARPSTESEKNPLLRV